MKNPLFANRLLDAVLGWYNTVSGHDVGAPLNKVANSALAMHAAEELPMIVCLCGSTRFKADFLDAQLEETLAGRIVLTVGGFPHADNGNSPEDVFGEQMKANLDVLHKRKIDLADQILVLNREGYVGKSTISEIEYAMRTGKLVRWAYPDSVPQLFASRPAEAVG